MPRRTRPARRTLLTVLTVGLLLAALADAAPALAATAPYWQLTSTAAPANLAPGSEGRIIVTASNLGDAVTSGSITVADRLPAGLVAKEITGSLASQTGETLECNLKALTCTDPNKPLQPATGLKITIRVKVEEPPGTVTSLANEMQVTGGGAPSATASQPVSITAAPSAFGVERYSFKPEEEGGGADAIAGSHPFQLTTTLSLNQNSQEEPLDLPKNLQFSLPPGLLGNPKATPRCSQVDFTSIVQNQIGAPVNLCGPETVVGVAQVTIDEPLIFQTGPETRTVPVFNLEPANGEPARFGIVPLKVPVVLGTSIRTGSDYGVVVTATSTDEAAGLVSSIVSFWGVPGDPRHDAARGWACVEQGLAAKPCKEQVEDREKKEKEHGPKEPKPFLVLPTSCGTVLKSPVRAQSWVRGAEYTPSKESEFSESLEGCAALPFGPSLEVQPESQSGSTPSGLNVTVKVPQEETAGGVAEAAVKATTVSLPQGLQLNPAAAGGLLACSALQAGFLGGNEREQTNNNEFSPTLGKCPDAAKVGTVAIKSPDLENELIGSVYLAAQDTNPFEAPLVLYLIAQDEVSGVVVKLAGKVTPVEGTGQLVSTFENTPEVPFERLQIHFFGGEQRGAGRASVATPPLCGAYEASSSFVPWSGNPAATPGASFSITSGPGGGGCSPNPQPFGPSFAAGSTNLQAGAFTNFALTINRPDGNQALQSLTTKLPPGMAAMLSSLTPCPEPQAARNECGPASLVGHSIASSGLGGEPVNLPGQVFLTGAYKGAPFGLSVVTPAVAGPFNLGDVTVRSTISVDPNTAAVTVTSDPFPTMLKGVPTQIKQISVMVDRPGFQFNPTSCNRMSVSGSLAGSQGGSEAVSSPFQVANCAGLPFAPKLRASVDGKGSKANGVGFYVNLESPGLGQANIHEVELQLPIALPSRLSTIQQACPDNVFEANPAACGEGSLIGRAVIHTPVLKNPLEGPAYLVSHANLAFPDVVFVLQGEGIKLILDGHTDIKKGITYSRFESAPDAPFTTFETSLPAGPHSALGVNVAQSKNYSLCGALLAMPTKIIAQNGAQIDETTQVTASGCSGVKGFKATRAQLLAKALKACRKKKNKHKRVACERAARKKYGPVHKSHSKKKKK